MNVITITVKVDYWLPRHVQVIRKILDRSLPYQRQNAPACDEVRADLPAQRIRIEDPFSVTGLAGSFEVLVHEPSIGPTVLNTGEVPGISGNVNYKYQHITPQMAVQKKQVYILLFTCATTRAVHLEIT
jgi:hypothetical protein